MLCFVQESIFNHHNLNIECLKEAALSFALGICICSILDTVPLILEYQVHVLDRQIFTSTVMSCISAYSMLGETGWAFSQAERHTTWTHVSSCDLSNCP